MADRSLTPLPGDLASGRVGVFGGAPMKKLTDNEIRQIIREKLNDGRLPTHLPPEPCPGWPECKFCRGPNER